MKLSRHEKLINLIRQEITTAGGAISFARYMELALYAPELGYYCTGTHKFGKSGDFVTAPELSPIFAQCIARQCQQIFSHADSDNILEFGAGSGIFACDLLLELEKLKSLPENYYIIEISPDLRERQKTLLKSTCPHLANKVTWLSALPKNFSGVVFANEVIDAMPVHCFQMVGDKIQERFVTWNKDKFDWQLQKPDLAVIERLTEFSLPDGYQSEVNLMATGWLNSIAEILTNGLILLIDYGYGRNEYYHPERTHGTLTCFHQHHKHDNPFTHVGLQDITAHVDFTILAESGTEAGLTLAGYTTQASFLLACGLLDIAHNDKLSTTAEYKQNQAIKTLTLPSQMGELIKVMGLTKNIELPLLGFGLHDRKRDL